MKELRFVSKLSDRCQEVGHTYIWVGNQTYLKGCGGDQSCITKKGLLILY